MRKATLFPQKGVYDEKERDEFCPSFALSKEKREANF